MVNFWPEKLIFLKILNIRGIPKLFHFNLLGIKGGPLKYGACLCAGLCACIIQRSARGGAFFFFFF